MQIEDLVVEVRDIGFIRRGQFTAEDLAEFTAVPTAIPVSDEVGVWSIVLPDQVMDDDGRMVRHDLCWRLRQPGAGIIVTGPGGTILSGPMTHAEMRRTIEDPVGTWRIEGVSDAVILEDALAYPSPAVADPNAQTAANDIRTGPAETIALEYIQNNIGPLAPVTRRNSRLVIPASLGRGAVRTKEPRFDNLLELVCDILKGTDLLADVVQVGTQLQLVIRQATDLSLKIRLDFDNDQVTETAYSSSAPTVTDVIVAGQGEGIDRTMVQRTSPSIWGRRIERFIDQRNTDVVAELEQSGDELLAEDDAEANVFQVVPNMDLGLVYGVSWSVGDIISVVIDGEPVPVPVTSASINVSAEDGVFVGAKVGNPPVTGWEDAVDSRLNEAEGRLSLLERSL